MPYSTRNRGLYIIIALLTGMLGFHNFYAGHLKKGGLQFLATVVSILIIPVTAMLSVLISGGDNGGEASKLVMFAVVAAPVLAVCNAISVILDIVETKTDGYGDLMR